MLIHSKELLMGGKKLKLLFRAYKHPNFLWFEYVKEGTSDVYVYKAFSTEVPTSPDQLSLQFLATYNASNDTVTDPINYGSYVLTRYPSADIYG